MSTEENVTVNKISPIYRADGVTGAERYLKRLCDRSFLSLWSYAGIYRDQGRGKTGDGKEVCDLLVVFEDHIIIFSDKDCEFPRSGNLELDWSRWFRRAVQKSADQVWGAERWIKSYPDRLYLDRVCTQPFPIDLPDLAKAKFHRIVVAHDASSRCRKDLGGSGSLMIEPGVVGAQHYASIKDGGKPFTVGQIDPAKGFVHVFDDTGLGIVMDALDTITDFVAYLTKKEQFIGSGRLVWAAGEEDLLAFYLKEYNDEEEHDFVVPPHINAVGIPEGHWTDFSGHPKRKAQLIENRVSYAWDKLIERFSHHILAGTSYSASHSEVREQEKLFRFFARESRTRRRILAQALLEFMHKTPTSLRGTRVVTPSKTGEPYYVFLLLPHPESMSYEQYRKARNDMLQWCCMVTKLKFPDAQDIIGIATEVGLGDSRSEDAIYYDARSWTPEEQAEAQELHEELGLLRSLTPFARTYYEYPELQIEPIRLPEKASDGKARGANQPRQKKSKRVSKAYKNKIGRGAPCPCQSGKTFSRCCVKQP
jgi:SEC-C motif